MSPIRKKIAALIPSGFLWRLTFLNIVVIGIVTVISGLALYNTACSLANAVGNMNEYSQQQFNATLRNYLLIFLIITITTGSILHFYLTKRFITPIRSLMKSADQMKAGSFPEHVEVKREDEIGQLIRKFNELVEQLNKNEQHRKKLVSDLSHEFRTPLSNLNGYLGALEKGDIEGDEKLFLSLYQESQRLTSLVEQLDTLKEWDYLSAQNLYQLEDVEITKLINQCVTMFHWHLNNKGITIQTNASPTKLHIHTEGIQQVITNLLDNAIRYYQGTSDIYVKGERLKNYYKISVEGPGWPIQEDEKEAIFERFYRLDHSRSRDTGGSGLGLAISKAIIKRHDGKIGVDTTDHANIFWILLPLN